MFMVLRKEKIVSYLISLSTVAFLFIMSFAMTNNNETVSTSANVVNSEHIENSTNIVNETNNINSVVNEINGNVTKKLQK